MIELRTRGYPGTLLGSPDSEQSTARAVRNMFAAVAPRYDFLNRLLSLGRDVAWRQATAKAVREILARPGSIALDLCCGTGDLALALKRVSAGIVIGSDFCQPMLELAQKKIGRGRSLFLLGGDSLMLPFGDNSLDVVTVAFGFRNLANYAAGLHEMRRVLKPGGVAAILEFSHVRGPVSGPLFQLYFHHILPRLGTWISGVRGPYDYLPKSVSLFPDQETLAVEMRGAGFGNVRYRNFSGGVAALHLGQKE